MDINWNSKLQELLTLPDLEEEFFARVKAEKLPVVIITSYPPRHDLARYIPLIIDEIEKHQIMDYTFCITPFALNNKGSNLPTAKEINVKYAQYVLICPFEFFTQTYKKYFTNAVDIWFPPILSDNLDVITSKYLRENINKFVETGKYFAEEKSINAYISYLSVCISKAGNFDYILPSYFLVDIIPQASKQAHFLIDCGAFDGDTIREFDKFTNGEWSKIIAFEPDKQNYEMCKKYVSTLKNSERITLVEKGVYSETGTLRFSGFDSGIIGMSAHISEEGTESIDVAAIDEYTENEELPVTIIKMDIEGAELKALEGARETILRDKPTLTICVYHKMEDLITIPQYIKSLVPEYKLFLRRHSVSTSDLVLYAVYEPEET
jgi:FkbM family methyltransferase